MDKRKQKNIVQITAAIASIVVVFLVILYNQGYYDFTFINRPQSSEETTTETILPLDTSPLPTDTPDVTETTQDTQPPAPPDYNTEIGKFQLFSELSANGWHITDRDYNGSITKLALVQSNTAFPPAYALRDEEVRTVEQSVDNRGGNVYTEGKTTANRPVLKPYMGYILYDDGTKISLMNSSGNTLIEDFSDYKPAYRRDLAGHPLFKKGDKYYFYYDGVSEEKSAVISSTIKAKDFLAMPAEVPTAYKYINAETEVIESLPKKAGMVECKVDTTYFNTLAIDAPASYAQSGKELYRFYERRITRTVTNQNEIDRVNALIAQQVANGQEVTIQPVEPVYKEKDEGIFWGYMDKNGNVVIEPQYMAAYEFSSNGYAVIVAQGYSILVNVRVIDTTGKVVIDAYRYLLEFAERPNSPVRDGYYPPDTYGIENLGMFYFDHNLLRVRRKLIDTRNGFLVVRETNELVDGSGKLFNIPAGYRLVNYNDGVMLLEKNGYYGFMSHTGKWIAQPVYTYAQGFSEGLAVLGMAGSAVGMIDTNGNVVLPFVFNHISNASSGVVCAYNAQYGWTIFNKVTTEAEPELVQNPILALKKRAIAEAKAIAEGYITPNP